MRAEKSPWFGLLKRCMHLYPPEFQARFADEILQTCADRLHDQPVGKAGFWLGTFWDLWMSILFEQIGEVRNRMRLSNICKGLGFLLIFLWFAGFVMYTGMGLLGWMVSESTRMAFDHAFFQTAAVSLVNGLMVMGPFLAFLAFLIPQLQVRADRANSSLEIQVLPMARPAAQMLLLSGLLSLVILGFSIAARL